MVKHILITGGAGFIGSHLADRLYARGDRIRILDNLDPQIHPNGRPSYLNAQIEFFHGDVRDRTVFTQALEGVDAVVHFAAAVGTGQSMYQIHKYADVNVSGFSMLLDILADTGAKPKIIFPGSATSYGECAHTCPNHGMFFPELRGIEQLRRRRWELLCPKCGSECMPVPTPEEQPLRPKFVYGIQKKTCEELLRAVGDAYDLPYVILRFFNVYGPRQSLNNPYTGVIPIFSSRIKNGHPPVVIEDGLESRDFVSVHDAVTAVCLSLDRDASNGKTFNVGTGKRIPILALARLLVQLHGSDLQPIVNYEFRKHDFRHSMANIASIQKTLGYNPGVSFEDGMRGLHEWTKNQEAVDLFDAAYQELKIRGMIGGPVVTKKPRVAAVTLNWNGFDNTTECVESLLRSSFTNLHIVVVDNGSANNEAERLKEKFPAIEVIPNKNNLGVAEGNNVGLRQVLEDPTYDYVVMINNDLLVTEDSIAALVREAGHDANIGMVASRMMNYFHRNVVDNLGIYLLRSGLGYNRKSQTPPLFCPCSGYGLYSTKALRAIRMPNGDVWDNDFFAYVDELDVGFQIRMLGYTASYADDAIAYHKDGAASGGSMSDFSLYHGHRNNVWFIVKDFPRSMLLRNALYILIAQIGTFFLYAKRRRLGVVFRAKRDALMHLPGVLHKRREVQRRKRVSTHELQRHMVRRTYIRP